MWERQCQPPPAPASCPGALGKHGVLLKPQFPSLYGNKDNWSGCSWSPLAGCAHTSRNGSVSVYIFHLFKMVFKKYRLLGQCYPWGRYVQGPGRAQTPSLLCAPLSVVVGPALEALRLQDALYLEPPGNPENQSLLLTGSGNTRHLWGHRAPLGSHSEVAERGPCTWGLRGPPALLGSATRTGFSARGEQARAPAVVLESPMLSGTEGLAGAVSRGGAMGRAGASGVQPCLAFKPQPGTCVQEREKAGVGLHHARPDPALDPVPGRPAGRCVPPPRPPAGPGWAPISGVPAGAGRLPPPWNPAGAPGRWRCWARAWRWRWRRGARPPRGRPRSCAATTSCGRWCGCAGARAGPPRTGGPWLAATVSGGGRGLRPGVPGWGGGAPGAGPGPPAGGAGVYEPAEGAAVPRNGCRASEAVLQVRRQVAPLFSISGF